MPTKHNRLEIILSAFLMAILLASCSASRDHYSIIEVDRNSAMLYPFLKDGLYGYMDLSGKIVIDPVYKSAGPFSEGYAAVRKDSFYGYIDIDGNIVIPLSYLQASSYSEGYAIVMERACARSETPRVSDTSGPYIFINKEGTNAFKKDFTMAQSFNNGYASVVTLDGKTAYLDIKGKVTPISGMIFQSNFIDGYACVLKEERSRDIFVILDTKLKTILRLEGYSNAYMSENGNIIVEKNNKYGVINIKNEIVIDFQYDYLSSSSDGLFKFRKDHADGSVNLYGQGYIDIDNNIIIPAGKFISLTDFENGFAIAADSKREGYRMGVAYGVINKEGEYIIQPEYEDVIQIGPGVFDCILYEDLDPWKQIPGYGPTPPVTKKRADESKYLNSLGEEIIPHP